MLSNNPHLDALHRDVADLRRGASGRRDHRLLIYLRGQFGWLAWPFAAGAAIFGFYAWRLYDIEGAERSFVRAASARSSCSIAVLGVAVPLMRPVFPSRALAEMVSATGCRNPVVAAAGYHEPSLVFLPARARAWSTARPPPRSCAAATAASRSSRAGRTAPSRSAPSAIGLRYSLRGRLDEQLQLSTAGARSASRSTGRRRSMTPSMQSARQRRAATGCAASAAISRAGSRCSAGRAASRRARLLPPTATPRARRACRHRAGRARDAVRSMRAAMTFARTLPLCGGRYLQRDHRFRPVRLVPRSARRS